MTSDRVSHLDDIILSRRPVAIPEMLQMLIALGRCLMSVIGGVAGLAVSLWFLIQRSLKEIDPGRLPSGDTMCGASICGIDVTAANQFVQSHFYVVLIAALVCAALGYASSYIFMPGESRKSSF